MSQLIWDKQGAQNKRDIISSMEEDIGATVELFMYDLTKGMARMMSQTLLSEWYYLCILTVVWCKQFSKPANI